MNTKTENKKIYYPIYTLSKRGKLYFPPEVINQIMWLHANVGNVEWSGILLYDVINGHPSNPETFELRVKHIFLMDIGTAGYTEYEADGDIVDMYDNVDGAMGMKIGHIHSHHTMTTSFSGTDNDELMTNVDKHNYYLSLIVNFSGNYTAKVAFLSDTIIERKISFRNDADEVEIVSTVDESKVMNITEMDIILDYNNEFFYSRFNQIREKMKEKEKKKSKPVTSFSNYYNKNTAYNSFTTSTKVTLNSLSDKDIECISRNVLSVDANLKETRSVYSMLLTIANSTDDELDLYYSLFVDNLDSVIKSFFNNRILASDEMDIVISEILFSIRRYLSVKRLKKLINNLAIILEQFKEEYGKGPIESKNVNEILDNEINQIENVY